MKKNLGNYESVDFFASQKAEVPEEDAEKTSEALYQFCKSECVKSLNAYLKERADLDNFNDPNYYEKAQIRTEGNVDLGDGKGVFPVKQVFRAKNREGDKEPIVLEDLKPY